MISPARKSISSPAAGMRTCWGRRLTRCISTRERAAFQSAMPEGGDVEVGAELAVDAEEQVQVERRRDAERVVIGKLQIAFRLDEIRAQQKRVAGTQEREIRRSSASAAGGSKFPMFEPRNTASVLSSWPARRSLSNASPGSRATTAASPSSCAAWCATTVTPGRTPMARDAVSSAARETSTRCTCKGGLVRGRDPRSTASLSPPGAQLDDPRERAGSREDLRTVAREQARFRARDRIPRQMTDRVEEGRAQRVVEVPRRQLPRRLRQVERDIRGEPRRQPFRIGCPERDRGTGRPHAAIAPCPSRTGTSHRRCG